MPTELLPLLPEPMNQPGAWTREGNRGSYRVNIGKGQLVHMYVHKDDDGTWDVTWNFGAFYGEGIGSRERLSASQAVAELKEAQRVILGWEPEPQKDLYDLVREDE